MTANLKPYHTKKESGVEWIEDVPRRWRVARLKRISRLAYGGALSTDVRQEGNIPVFGSNGRVGRHHLANTKSPCIVIGRKGSFGKVSYSQEPVFAIDTTFFVDRRLSRADLRWLFFVMGWMGLDQLSKDAAVPGLSREDVYCRIVPLPPHQEQVTIARFVDYIDRRIRRYIRVKQKLIALLEEKKQALIQEAVTGVIDVRTGRPYPAYKESGVEWLGTVPAHWDVWRSKRVFRPRTELARPGDIQLSATQAYGVIAQADYEEKIGRKVTRILRHLDQRRHVEVDDFVISMRSFQGGLERAWRSGCIRSSYIVLQAATELIVEYFGYLFKSVGYIAALQSTANFIRDGQDLNFENFCRVDVPFPPVEEQQHIVQAVDRGTGHIAASIERSHRQIGSLREYRTRLMADVVTGKLDVREAAAGLAETDSLGAEDDPADSIDHDADRLETATGS